MVLAGIEFKPVKGFEKFYEVSADGAVFSKIKHRFRTSVINEKTGYAAMVYAILILAKRKQSIYTELLQKRGFRTRITMSASIILTKTNLTVMQAI